MRNIVLIGYRGAGKTGVGKTLAAKIGVSFLDTDDMIEARTGRTIAEIVGQKGWSFFRKLEREALTDLGPVEGAVIATGGGIPEDPENREILRRLGRVVWLKATEEETVRRIRGDGSTGTRRPPLAGGDLLSEIEKILKRRNPCYEAAADWTVDTTGKAVDAVADEILRMIEGENHGRKHNRYPF